MQFKLQRAGACCTIFVFSVTEDWTISGIWSQSSFFLQPGSLVQNCGSDGTRLGDSLFWTSRAHSLTCAEVCLQSLCRVLVQKFPEAQCKCKCGVVWDLNVFA